MYINLYEIEKFFKVWGRTIVCLVVGASVGAALGYLQIHS